MLKSLPVSTQAVLIAVLAYASLSHTDMLTKFITQTYSVSTLLAIGGLIGTVVSGAWIYMAKGWAGFTPPTWKIHAMRALIVSSNSHFALNALKLIPLPEFYSIIFIAPIAVIILSTLLKHETFRPHRLITVLLGFAGVLLIVGTQLQTLGLGALLTFGCVIGSAISVLVIRRIGQGDYLPVYCFFPCLIIFLTSAPFAQWDLPRPDLVLFLQVCAFGGLMIVGHISIPLAYAKAPQASLVAPVFYTQMLWGLLYGITVFDQVPSWMTLAGAAMIIFGGLYMIWKEKRRPRAEVNTEVIMERD